MFFNGCPQMTWHFGDMLELGYYQESFISSDKSQFISERASIQSFKFILSKDVGKQNAGWAYLIQSLLQFSLFENIPEIFVGCKDGGRFSARLA